MEPTLHEGDRLLVLYGARARRGKLAVVLLPDNNSGAARPLAVKRIALPDPDGSDGWWVERDNSLAGVDSWSAGVGAIPADGIRALVLLRLPATRPPWLRLRIHRRGHKPLG